MRTDRQRAKELDQALKALEGAELSFEGRPAPDPAPELNELIGLAAKLREQAAPSGPDRAYVTATRQRILNRLAPQLKRTPTVRASRSWRGLSLLRRPALALAGLFLVFLLLITSTGVAYGAAGALPGDTLYGVKIAYEQTRIALATSPEASFQLKMRYLDRRLEELSDLERAGRVGDLPAAAEEYEQELNSVLGDAAGEAEGAHLEEAQQVLDRHSAVLEALLAESPTAASTGLETALEASSQAAAVLEALREGRSPREEAPGQSRGTEAPGSSKPDEVGPGKTPPGLDEDRTPGPPDGEGPPGLGGAKGTPGPPEGKGPSGQRGPAETAGPPENPGNSNRP